MNVPMFDVQSVRLTFGEFRLDFTEGNTKVFLSREGGEAMETTTEKIAPVLIAALDDFWRREF